MIEQLKNPLTKEYLEFKKYIYSNKLSWYYHPVSTGVSEALSPEPSYESEDDIPFYSHKIMERPSKENGMPYSRITSDIFPMAYKVLEQIFEDNDLDVSLIYRINLNATFAVPTGIKKSVYHVDLNNIPHKNLIIYMSKLNGGGETYVKDGTKEMKFAPEENNIIMFDGELQHCSAPPHGKERRIIMVSNIWL